MRIIIESEERPNITPPPTSTGPTQVEASDAGPPAASPFQSATAPAGTGNFREGIDAGGPPASLVESLQGDASLPKVSGSEDLDAGSAPEA